MKGKLRGKFVMLLPAPPATPQPSTPPPIQRFTDAQLSTMPTARQRPTQRPAQPAHHLPGNRRRPRRALPPGTPELPAQEAGFFAWVENALSAAPAAPTNARPAAPAANTGMPSRAVVTRFYFEEGVAGFIEPGPVRNGAFFAITDTGETIPWKKDPTLTKTPPQIVVAEAD